MSMSVRKTGAQNFPWEARCSEHREEEMFLTRTYGAVEFNTKGVGNRLWILAMRAAEAHWNKYHKAPQ